MNLCLDIGNSWVKAGLFDRDRLVETRSLASFQLENSVGLAWLHRLFTDYPSISRQLVSSVIAIPSAAMEALESYTLVRQMAPGMTTNFINRYQSPETLGTDRIAVLTAARTNHTNNGGYDQLIIQAGTCMVYDLLTKEGEFLGGLIAPGLEMRAKALHTFTGRLPLINPKTSELGPFLGKNTNDCMIAGTSWGALHECLGFMGQYQTAYPSLRILLTGGDAKFFDTPLKNTIFAHQITWVPELVLIGLNRILTLYDA